MDVTVHGPLRGVTGSKTLSVPDADAEMTVHDVLDQLADAYPRTRTQLFTDDGSVQGSVRVMVDGEVAALDAACPPTADIEIVPAVRGGGHSTLHGDQ